MDNVARGGRRDLPEDTENSTMHRTERTNPTSTTPGLRTPLSPRLEVQDWPGDAINVNLQPLGSSNTQRPTRRLNVAGSGTVGQRGKAEGSDGQVRQGKGAEQGVEAEWQMRDAGLGVRRASDRLDNLEAWRSRLQPGSHLDVKDTVDKWCEAEVLTVDNALGRVFITYTYWSSKWNEWLGIESPCLALADTKVYHDGGPLRIGHRIEALDETHKWLEAEVVEERQDGWARIHFRSHAPKYDRWVSPDSGEVRQYGPYRQTAKGNRGSVGRKASLAPGQQHVRQIAQLSSRYEHYCRALESKGLRVVPVEGDGNCLFRSVSHQVYGDDSHHRLVRARCMDYMESEAHFFEPYVEGDMAAFISYLNVKRRNAVWGDDPEVQALCEIYDRPAEIWAYDPQLGAKTLRTFHEAAGNASDNPTLRRPPMRLSYYGGGHYDSIAPFQNFPMTGSVTLGVGLSQSSSDMVLGLGGVIAETQPEPGRLEEEALERSRQRAAEAGDGRWDVSEMKQRREDESASERSAMDHALALSRTVFEAQFDDLDSALVASVDHMEQSNLSSLEAASRDSELVVLQEEMIRTAQAQSEEEQLRHALEASCNTAAAAAAEADMVRQAIAESMGGVPGGTSENSGDVSTASGAASGASSGTASGTAASDIGASHERTGAMDEEEELKRVLALSGIEGGQWGVPGATVGDYELDDMDQDPELRQAIKASLSGQ